MMSKQANFLRLAYLVVLVVTVSGSIHDNVVEETYCSLPDSLVDEIQSYKVVANKIINSLINGKFKVSDMIYILMSMLNILRYSGCFRK